MELRPILSAMLRSKTGVFLIAIQIALTLAILANAAYIVNDRVVEARKKSGVDEDRVFMISTFSYNEKADHLAQQKIDEAQLRAIPGITKVAAVNQIPLSQSGSNSGFSRKREQKETTTNAAYYLTSSSLVDLFGLKLIEGRDFSPSEFREIDPNKEAEKRDDNVALISKSFGKTIFPELDNFTGQVFYLGIGDDADAIRVIGVYDTLVTPWGRAAWSTSNRDGTQTIIMPAREIQPYSTFALRADSANLEPLMNAAEKTLLAATTSRVIPQKSSMTELRKARYRGDYFLVGLLMVVMLLLVTMTAAGIVGLASLWVNQRRKQIGVRRALGARRIDILRYFLLENFLMTSIGAIAGIGLALALNHALMSSLEMQRLPIIYLVFGIVSVIVLGLLAVLNPALRAASVPPAEATRSV